MPVQRRKDTGAWEVVVPRPSMAPIRRSSARWTHADALAYERKLTSNHHTLEDGLDKWLVEYAHYLRARKSLESAANLLRPFIKNKTFEDVPELVGVLRRAWSELQPATINRRMAILRRVCNLAYKEWRWIDTPVAGTVRPLRENNERHYYLTRAEVERLRMNCTVSGAGELIVLAAFTGLRLGEILSIQPGDVRDHSLHLRKTKNGRPRVVPLHPRAEAIAAKLPLPDVTQAVLRKQFVNARTEAGLEHIHFHDLRHTFASWMIQTGTPLNVLKELMGHKTIQMTMRYAHLCADNLRAAIDRLPLDT